MLDSTVCSDGPHAAGGRIWLSVTSQGLRGVFPDTHIRVRGTSLHAPLVERVLELPFDINAGVPSLRTP